MYHGHGSGSKAFGAFMAGAAVALAVGGYLLYGPGGRQRRDDLEGWIDETKDAVVERLAHMKEATRSTYDALVDEITEDYAAARDLTEAQAKRLSARLKARFRELRRIAEESAEDARRETEDLEGRG